MRDRQVVKSYTVAVLAVLAATLVRFAIDPWVPGAFPFLIFFAAVFVAAWRGGLGPGIAASLLSTASAGYFFMEPAFDVTAEPEYVIGLGMFLTETVAISYFTGRSRRVKTTAQEHLRAMEIAYETSPIGMCQLDREGRYLRINRRLVEMNGIPAEAHIGKTIREIVPALADAFEPILKRILQTGQPLIDIIATGDSQAHPGVPHTFLESWYPQVNDRQEVVAINVVIQDITYLKETEERLRARNQELQIILNNTPFLLARCTRDLRYQFVSSALARLLGADPQEIVGKPIVDVLGQAAFDRLRPHIETVLEGRAVEFEPEMPIGNLGVRLFHVIYTPDRNAAGQVTGWIASILDITDRRRSEQALRANERLQRVLSHISDLGSRISHVTDLIPAIGAYLAQEFGVSRSGLSQVDLARGDITVLEDYHGTRPSLAGVYSLSEYGDHWRADGLSGRTTAIDDLHADARTAAQFHSTYAPIDVSSYITVPLHREGRWVASFWMAHHAPRRWDPGDIDLMQAVSERVWNLVQRKQAEEELVKTAAAVQRLNQELEARVNQRTQELVQSQSRLRALASELNLAEQRERKHLATELHDHLQQHLVLGKLKTAQAKKASGNQAACLDSLNQLDDVLTESLEYTRTLVAELSPPVLRDHGLLAGLKWLGDYMKRHDLDVSVLVPDRLESKLPDDQVVLLFQSVRELLINTAKHAGSWQASVVVEERDQDVRIEVSDQGKGFVPESAAATGSVSSKFGLFSIAERMRELGGTFVIESSPGTGTRAILGVPRPAPPPVRPAAIQQPRPYRPHEPSSTPVLLNDRAIRLVLVDDHAMVRQGLRTLLEGYGDIALVGEAGDGEEAVRLVESLRPDVVVMDINMPRMGGIEATQRIRDLYPEVRVIGLSVNADPHNQAEMQKAGATLLLTKEAAMEELYAAIQRAMARAQLG